MLAAVKAEDLQAFAAVWGNASGSVRDQWPRAEVEMRAFYNLKCIRHDKYQLLSDASAPGGGRVLSVQLTYGTLTRATNFTVTRGPQERWYVLDIDLKPVNDICLKR